MRISIVTHCNKDYNNIADITTPIMLKYARQNGYDFHFSNFSFDDRPSAWHKIPLLFESLNFNDWIVWMDADTLIMDFSYRLEDFIDNNYIAVTGFSHQIETGVFFIKNCAEIRELFLKAYDKEEFINDGGWEQTAVQKVLEENPDLEKRIKKISMDPINLDPNRVNPPGIHPLSRAPGMVKYNESTKPFIIHAGWGLEREKRKEIILKEYIPLIKGIE